jgi:branched-chain amino acid transport system substrate-binding protein
MEAAFKAFSEKMNIKKVGVLAQADAFGKGIKETAIELAPKYNLEITEIETFQVKDTDMTVQLAKLRLAGSQAVVLGGNVPTCGYITKSAGTMGWDVILYAGAPGADPSTAEIGGAAAQGFLISTNFIPGNPRPGAQAEFASMWNKATGKKLTLGALLGACATQVLIAAIEKASITNSGEINRKTITDALQNLEVETAGGRLSYTPNSHEGGTIESIVLARLKDGDWKIWEPNPIKNRYDW